MASTTDVQPAAMLAETPPLFNPNRLYGPVKGLDYLGNEVPTEISAMICEKLLDGGLRSGLGGLAMLSCTSRQLKQRVEPLLYQWGGKRIEEELKKKLKEELNQELIKRGGMAGVRMTLNWGEKVKRIKTRDLAPILWGAKRGRLATVNNAIEYGADVDASYGLDLDLALPCETAAPIHWAVVAGHDEVVKSLLRAGASLDNGSCGLCNCSRNSVWSVVKFLDGERMYRGDFWLPLHLAICHKRTSTAELLLAQDSISPWMNTMSLNHHRNGKMETKQYPSAIHVAAQFSQHTLFPLMVEKAAAGLDGWADPRFKPGKEQEQGQILFNRDSTHGPPLYIAASTQIPCLSQHTLGRLRCPFPDHEKLGNLNVRTKSQSQDLRDCLTKLLKGGARPDADCMQDAYQPACRPKNTISHAISLTQTIGQPDHMALGVQILNLILDHTREPHLTPSRREKIQKAIIQGKSRLQLEGRHKSSVESSSTNSICPYCEQLCVCKVGFISGHPSFLRALDSLALY
ncbi:hypothetical protein V8F33_006275 [Rhypophila sp. PSN 637]